MSPGRPGAGPGGGGKLSRRAALLLLGGGALTSLTATGAFSSVSGPRPVRLGTESDDNALLGLMSGEDGDPADAPLNAQIVSYNTNDGGTIDIAELGNNVGEPVEITTLTLEPEPQDPNSSELSISLDSVPSNLEFGQSQVVSASVSCPDLGPGQSSGPVNVVLSVVAEGESTSVTLERTVTVNCRNCVPCDSGTDELVKYEWVGTGHEDTEDSDDGDDEDDGGDGNDEDGDDEDSDDGDDEDDGDDSDDGNSGFTTEGSDSNIELTGRTLDDEGEPVEACFSVDYCNVDVVVKAATNYETYENRSRTVCVTDIDGHAISNVRFFCDAPDDVTVGNGTGGRGGDDEDNDGGDGDDDGDDGDEGGPPDNPGNGRGTGGSGPGGDDEDSDDD